MLRKRLQNKTLRKTETQDTHHHRLSKQKELPENEFDVVGDKNEKGNVTIFRRELHDLVHKIHQANGIELDKGCNFMKDQVERKTL